MQHVWVFCCPISEVTLSGDPGNVAFSQSFARVSCNIHSVASNHGKEVVAPLEF
jgi:hypothetical protein